MQYDKTLRNILAANVEHTMGVIEPLLADVHRAGELIADCFLGEGKLMSCSGSGAVAISQHLTSILVNGFEYERPSLPALALTTDTVVTGAVGEAGSRPEVYARQVRALGRAGDVLLLFAANTHSEALVQAVIAAHDRHMQVVAITGADDQDISSILAPEDNEIYINTCSHARIVEAHILLAHCFCKLIEHKLFGIGDSV